MARPLSRPDKMQIGLTLDQYFLVMKALEEISVMEIYPEKMRRQAWDLCIDLEDSQAIRLRELRKRQRLYDEAYASGNVRVRYRSSRAKEKV